MKFFFLTFLLATTLSAKDRMVILGGGGESADKVGTIFDGHLKNVRDYAANSNYETEVYFNGGHTKTEEIKKGFQRTLVNSDFDAAAFNKMLSGLSADIKAGKIKPGEQLFLYIDSHGEKAKEGESAHHIAGKGGTTNLVSFSGTERINMADLQTVITMAEDAGIKLALYDASCFSGSTLKLNAKKSCVMTSTGDKHFAYASNPFKDSALSPYKDLKVFSDLMTEGLKAKKFSNLEDLYLDSRKASIGADFPQMNTPEGKSAGDFLYQDISDYLELEASNINTIKDVVKKLNSLNDICLYDKNFELFDEKLSKLEKNVTGAVKESFGPLRKSLKEYHDLIGGQARANVILNQFNNKKVSIDDNGNVRTYSMREFLSIDTEKLINQFKKNRDEELKGTQNEDQRKEVMNQFGGQIAFFEKVAETRKKMLKSSIELSAAYKGISDWNKDNDKNAALAFQVGVEARKVYDALYRAKSSKSNPCREFKL